MPFEPVILFFLLGLLAGVVRSDLKIPGVLYESLSIFLLLAIGLKGGIELARCRLPRLSGRISRPARISCLVDLRHSGRAIA